MTHKKCSYFILEVEQKSSFSCIVLWIIQQYPTQMMAAIKAGSISHSRFAQLAEMAEEDQRKKITVERSGGGV